MAGASHASSLPEPWRLPKDYAGSGSTLPQQAAPGARVLLRSHTVDFDESWWYYPDPWTFQWYRDGVAIPGATAWTLTLQNVTAADSGIYAVRWSGPGFPAHWEYYPLTVAPPPPTPLISSVTTAVAVYDGQSEPLRLLSGGRIAIVVHPKNQAAYYGTCYVVRADGTIEQTVSAGDRSWESFPQFLPSGRYLRTNEYIPAVAALLGTSDYFLSPLDEAADGKITLRAARVLRTWVREAKEVVVRLNADLTVDPTFDAAANQVLGRAVPVGGRFLQWNGTSLVAVHGDGTADPTFPTLDVATLWPGLSNADFPGISTTKIQPLADGTVLLAVVASDPGTTVWRTHFIRLQADGTPRFDTRGSLGTSFGFVLTERGEVYQRGAGRAGLRRYDAVGDDRIDRTFYSGTESSTGDPWDWFLLQPDGSLVAGKDAWPNLIVARLRTTDVAPPTGPEVLAVETTAPVPAGRVELVPRILGSGPFTYEWTSLDGGELPANTTSSSLVFDSLSARNLGTYLLRVTGPGGGAYSQAVSVRPRDEPRLAALSGRGVADAGDATLIAGWSVQCNSDVLVRGVGPSLAPYGVTSFARDPAVAVFGRYGGLFASNDNWEPAQADTFARVGAAPLLNGSKDAAAALRCSGVNTLHLSSPAGRGVALAEVYDSTVGAADRIRLSALSLRGFAGRGDETLIGGFVLDDASGFRRPQRLLLRVVGPTLRDYGIAQPLADPLLRLFGASGQLVASNDNWEQQAASAELVAATAKVGLGALPAGSRDAALLVELPPGAFTIHAEGVDGATGVALIEIYRVN